MVKRPSIHYPPEAAGAAPAVLVIAQIKRRGEGRRRTPNLLAGKGGGRVCRRAIPLPFRPVVWGSFAVPRREFSSAQSPTPRTRLRQPQDDSELRGSTPDFNLERTVVHGRIN